LFTLQSGHVDRPDPDPDRDKILPGLFLPDLTPW
jgi:hypothetical protein